MNPLKSIASVTTYVAAVSCIGLLSSLAFSAGNRVYTGAGVDTGATPPAVDAFDFASGAICQMPNMAGRMIQLAQTEVSPMARQAAQDPAAAFANAEPPLWSTLGTITYKVSTANPEAQKYFDQGLRLAYAFNHAEAGRAFRKAQKLDPECAMCAWGEALVLGPHVNMRMDPAAVPTAWAALNKAKALAGRASPREQALIAALSARYTDDPKADRAPLDKAYADAMGRAAAQFPDDIEIATLLRRGVDGSEPVGLLEAGRRTSRTRRASTSCRRWSASSPRTRTMPARSICTSTPWKPPTGRSARRPMPTALAARCRVRATWSTCRATSTSASAAIRKRSMPTSRPWRPTSSTCGDRRPAGRLPARLLPAQRPLPAGDRRRCRATARPCSTPRKNCRA